jgi:DNA mismatch repair ATPase MutL
VKKLFLSEEQNILITKKLANYLDTESEPIKGKCSYETFDNNDSFNDKQKDRENFNEKNNSNSTENQSNGKYNSYQKNKKQKGYDQQNDINSLFANSTKNNTNYGSDKSFDNIVQSDNLDKTKRLVRFAGDYCRASPNMLFKEKYSLLSCGWRSLKSSFVVEYDYFSKISGEKRTVCLNEFIYFLLIFHLKLKYF